ncbi:hypothetical protein CCACVL1_18045 [Corchorus capsularis]|uniref:Uncharacterized protein n=1 Tax=Corchorus capsularis TaxID=210143 RepID=A0A1R3HNL1_COCAP|nr:hypothetical protein CCACVL1_18045 [Corchorus capsularis]
MAELTMTALGLEKRKEDEDVDKESSMKIHSNSLVL